jgi:predicted ATPase
MVNILSVFEYVIEFMREIIKRIVSKRKQKNGDEVIKNIAKEVVQESWLLCFDELQLPDVGNNSS